MIQQNITRLEEVQHMAKVLYDHCTALRSQVEMRRVIRSCFGGEQAEWIPFPVLQVELGQLVELCGCHLQFSSELPLSSIPVYSSVSSRRQRMRGQCQIICGPTCQYGEPLPTPGE